MNPVHERPEDAAQYITVSDPVQHSEGMNKYTSYRVDFRPPPPSQNNITEDVFQNSNASAVLRRYSDFLWLYNRLHKERAGAIVPPLPEKQAVSRFSTSFIEERRQALERFLKRVAVHPELYDAKCLDIFLKADDITFQTAKNAKSVPGADMGMSVNMAASMNMGNQQMNMNQSMNYGQMPNNGYGMNNSMMMNNSQMMMPNYPPPKKDGIKKWFAETKTSIAGELVRSPDDDLFQEIERYVEGLEKQMKNVQQQASALVKKNKEIANGLHEFGVAFHVLGQSEADDLGHALENMGSAADELSGVSMTHSEAEMIQFEEPLKDYLKTIQSVKIALEKRHNRRLTYSSCLAEVNAKRANLAKLRATPGSEAKAYGAEMSLKRGEAAADAARDVFATVSQRVLREVDRFKREKGDDMRRVVLDYINLQIDYNQKMEQVWAQLLPKLESLHVPGESNGQHSGNVNIDKAQMPKDTNTDGTIPANVITNENNSQQQPNNVYQSNISQSMLGLENSVQYRDNSNVIPGM